MDDGVLVNQDGWRLLAVNGWRSDLIGGTDMSSKSTIVGYTSANWNKPKEFLESVKLHLQECVIFFCLCVGRDGGCEGASEKS